MSAISSIGAGSALYPPIAPTATQAKPATTSASVASTTGGKDPDHDGDTDGPGLDVKG